jgi:hypothetical protein
VSVLVLHQIAHILQGLGMRKGTVGYSFENVLVDRLSVLEDVHEVSRVVLGSLLVVSDESVSYGVHFLLQQLVVPLKLRSKHLRKS